MATAYKKTTTTKADLTDQVYRRHGGLTKSEAAEIVDAIFGTVKSALGAGRPVRIKNFGIFEVRDRPGRRGINPSNGEEMRIAPSRGLSFRPSKILKSLVAPIDGEKGSRRQRPR